MFAPFSVWDYGELVTVWGYTMVSLGICFGIGGTMFLLFFPFKKSWLLISCLELWPYHKHAGVDMFEPIILTTYPLALKHLKAPKICHWVFNHYFAPSYLSRLFLEHSSVVGHISFASLLPTVCELGYKKMIGETVLCSEVLSFLITK